MTLSEHTDNDDGRRRLEKLGTPLIDPSLFQSSLSRRATAKHLALCLLFDDRASEPWASLSASHCKYLSQGMVFR